MPYFTCIFSCKDTDEPFVDTTHDIRAKLRELRAQSMHKLLYYEHFTDASKAIDRHRQLIGEAKDTLTDFVRQCNPEMEDLAQLL